MEIYIFLVSLLGIIVYLDQSRKKDIKDVQKNNTELLRETILAIKSKDVVEYTETMKTDWPLPVEKSEDFTELDQIDPTQLLKAINEENGNK